jgi:hypothetical protein
MPRDLGQDLGRKATPHEGCAGDHEGYDLVRTLPDLREPPPFEGASQREIKQRVELILRNLNPRKNAAAASMRPVGSARRGVS